ncbi:MAG: hypothetical protein ACJAS1_007445, partial [Oleiphilaceae bacterium]
GDGQKNPLGQLILMFKTVLTAVVTMKSSQ